MKIITIAALTVFWASHTVAAQGSHDSGTNETERAAIPTVSSLLAPGTYKLAPKFAPPLGTKFSQNFTMRERNTKTMSDASAVVRQTTLAYMSALADGEVVAHLPGGNVQVRVVVRDMKLTAEMADAPGQAMPGDKGINALGMSVLKAMDGKSLLLTYAPRGNIVKIEGATDLTDQLLNDFPAAKTTEREAIKSIAETMTRNLVSTEQGLMKPWILLPANSVGAGDTWQETKKEMWRGDEMTTTTNYHITSMTASTLCVTFKTKMTIRNIRKPTQSWPLSIMTATESGVVYFDVLTGIAHSGQLSSYFTNRTIPFEGRADPLFGNEYIATTKRISTTFPARQ